MNTKLLQEIGLSEGETKVYLALLRLGATKTGPLAKKAEVSSSKVYKILDRLTTKGLAGYVRRGKVKYFTAMQPKRVLEYIEEKEAQLREKKELVRKLIPELELAQKMSGTQTEAVIYDGFKAVTNAFRQILDELKSGETYYVIGAGYGEVPALRPFFHNHHMQRVDKGIKVKMLANHDTKDNLVATTQKNSEVKYLPQYLITNMEIVIYKNKSLIVLWTKHPTAFLIQSDESVKSFKAYFDAFWKIAKKG